MNTWQELIQEESQKPYYQNLMHFLDQEYATKTIYPPREQLFTCFEACAYEQVKVVILGQDPYHGENQAHGLCFSVPKGEKIPPSLRNIYKELQADLGIVPASHGNLMQWANQGVFLLNAVMSVEAGKAGSHQKKGWEIFTDTIIQKLNEREAGIVFLLWGNWAIKKGDLITNPNHVILTSAHPSPLSASRGFLGSKPFSKVNEALEQMGQQPIDWRISE